MWRNRYAFVGYSTLELLLRFAFVASAKQSTRARVCAPVRVKAGLLTSAPAQTDFVYVPIDGSGCSTAARQRDYLDCQ